MPQNEPITGGCACGEIRYQLAKKPLFVNCCHCSWCQRESGAAFAINAMIEAKYVTLLQGQPVPIATPSNSKKGQVFWRCPACQIALWSVYAGAGDKVNFIRVGSLDKPEQCPPDIHIYTSSKQSWVVLPKNIPAMPGYYDRNKQWPAASLRRLAIVNR
ncbi:Gfa-like protein [hydrothermal vent metagenome]|uniref:Gfa-like protein n=1 Tax=hydrothermal vent metagenome TaxID=652676 RepID=A0A3B0RHV9_9ZZZZ